MLCVCEVPLHQPQDRQTAGSGRAVSGIRKYRRFDHGARMPPQRDNVNHTSLLLLNT